MKEILEKHTVKRDRQIERRESEKGEKDRQTERREGLRDREKDKQKEGGERDR